MKKIGIALLTLVLFASVFAGGIYGGLQLAPRGYFGDTEITDITLLELIDLLKSDHYKQPTDEDLYKGLLKGLVESVDDPYTSYFDYEEYSQYLESYQESYVGIGVTISSREDYLVVEAVNQQGPADQAGILPNDLIVQVGDVNIAGMNFYDVRNMIVGEEGTTVIIYVIREGYDEPIPFEIERQLIESPTVTYDRYLENGQQIGVITVSTFGDETAQKFSDAVDALEALGIDGLVIDLRNNGGGHLSTVLSMLREFLVDDDRAMFYTEQYTNGEKTTSEYHAILNEKKPYDIVTLVNGNSASASEVFASSMQEHGGYKLVGEVTFGKGTMQQDRYVESTCIENTFGTLDCSEADRIHISIGTWYTTNHNWVHFDGGSDGITPDILVEKSENELLYKLFLLNDETLEFDTVDDRTVIVQKILNIMGYDVRTDGYFDQETYDAIIDIQSNNALTETGIINNETMSILNEALDNYKNNPTNDTQLQEAINYLTN